jgi:hypothetical protein
MEPLKKGQEVTLKVVKLKGTVSDSGLPDPDAGMGEGGTLYKVHFPEQTMFVRRANLVTVAEPDTRLQQGTGDWYKEFEHLTVLLSKWQANTNDQTVNREVFESCLRLGFIVPNADSPLSK